MEFGHPAVGEDLVVPEVEVPLPVPGEGIPASAARAISQSAIFVGS